MLAIHVITTVSGQATVYEVYNIHVMKVAIKFLMIQTKMKLLGKHSIGIENINWLYLSMSLF